MKYLSLCLLFVIFLLASPQVNAQNRTYGEVVDVINGKTVVVMVPTGRVKVELQYIDVPEAGQPLHSAMSDHVKSLVVGKSVELQTKGFTRDTLTGKLILNGVDVSQQLLRNGAAWHVPFERSGQNRAEFEAYAESESLARLEKRGVWSVAGLEPAWEYREKQKLAAKPATVPSRAASFTEVKATTAKKKGYWSDDNPRLKAPNGLSHGFNAATQTGFLGMAVFGVIPDKSTPPGQQTGIELIYYYTENGAKGRTGYFHVTVYSIADKYRFLKDNVLTVEADGKKHVVGRAKREATNSEFNVTEKLTYTVSRATIEKIAHGADVKIKVGDAYMTPKPMVQMLLYNMLQAAK